MRLNGIFAKVFAYTTIFLIVIITITVALFAQQFVSFYDSQQSKNLAASYEVFFNKLQVSSVEDIGKIADEFYRGNQSFSFYIEDADNLLVYSTPNSQEPDSLNGTLAYVLTLKSGKFTLYAKNDVHGSVDYSSLIIKIILAIISMLILGVLGAYIFAKQMTKPIIQLSHDTHDMSNLATVSTVIERDDEIGILSQDVHAMYNKLRETISMLENEVLKVKELEENQRNFFSAASHELKTPIAATSVLLEGMLANLGDYQNHPKYLHECLKLMNIQASLISEILELVNLDGGKIKPNAQMIKIVDVVNEIIPAFQTLAEANNQQLQLDIPLDQFSFTDKSMLQKVLSNILMNAVQNTPSGGSIRIMSTKNNGLYSVSVFNSGAYIDERELLKLFEPFYRVDKARSRGRGYSGLGLTIVQKMLQAMDLPFSLRNTDDGVLFQLDLPIAEVRT